jgi:hypothetical protein
METVCHEHTILDHGVSPSTDATETEVGTTSPLYF